MYVNSFLQQNSIQIRRPLNKIKINLISQIQLIQFNIYIYTYIQRVMKNKSKQIKQVQPSQKSLKLQLTWQKITDMENALRRIATTHVTLPFDYQTIETIIKFTKQLIKAIQVIKSQQKHYQSIQQNYNLIQSKLANHDNIVNSLEQHHMQRLKTLSDQIKNSKQYYDKAKKNLQESQQQARAQYEQIKKQNTEIRYKIQIIKKQKQDLLKQIQLKNATIKDLKEYKERFIAIATDFKEMAPKQNQLKLTSLLCSALAHRITAYLPPADIINLQSINKQTRFYLTKSKKVQNTLSKNIISVKNRKIAYFHRHIEYFQKLYHKIPEQILQSTFYRYEIMKQNIGTEMLNILNNSAMLFQGKFQDIDDQQFKQRPQREEMFEGNKSRNVVIGGMTFNIDNQIKNLKEFNIENPSNILQIDQDIIRQFLEDKKTSKQKVYKQISIMYSKIKTTAQLYSVDVESIGKFMTNILINFSKVFVLSKNLFAQARNLQSLNTLILRQLANWDKIQIQKNSQIQDLKAELEAEKKLRIFFTQKSMKSQQRALAQENVKLGIESKLMRQGQKLDLMYKQKQELTSKLSDCQRDIKNLKSDNKQIRRAYQNGKQKYNKIIQQLSVVKETILRMNIM